MALVFNSIYIFLEVYEQNARTLEAGHSTAVCESKKLYSRFRTMKCGNKWKNIRFFRGDMVARIYLGYFFE